MQVSAENVHDAPRAGLTFVAAKADRVFVSDLTAALMRSVARLYRVVIIRRRFVNDCINAWPAFVIHYSLRVGDITLQLPFVHEKTDGI